MRRDKHPSREPGLGNLVIPSTGRNCSCPQVSRVVVQMVREKLVAGKVGTRTST